jgi:hypothetical protein
MDEYEYDLFWHAMNYRGAASEHAELAWKELEACVKRIVDREVEDAVRAEAEAHNG